MIDTRCWQGLALGYVVACSAPASRPRSGPVDVHVPEQAFPGYTLYTSLGGDGTHYLVDMQGDVVHSWDLPPAHYGWLLPDGHMLSGLTRESGLGTAETRTPAGRAVGEVVEVDWDGGVVRRWEHDAIHHDYDVLPDGNLLALTWSRHPRPEEVPGGIPGTEYADGVMLSEAVREITPAGDVVWEWLAEEHLDPEAFPICPSTTGSGGWTRTRSSTSRRTTPCSRAGSWSCCRSASRPRS